MPPLLNDDALNPGTTQPMSPTQPMPWRQKIGPCIIQQQLELEESPDILEHAYVVENQACETNAVKRFKVVGCSGSQGSLWMHWTGDRP